VDVDFVLLDLEMLVVVLLGGSLVELDLGLFCGWLLLYAELWLLL
jgi:hypothetical protein